MPHGLKLIRSTTIPVNHKHLRAFRLRIDAIEPTGGMTPFVFVHRRHPTDPYDESVFDEFCTVASVPHLADIPEAAPGLPPPFFRKSFVERDVRSEQEAKKFWELMETHVCALVKALDGLDDLVLQETFICGAEGEVTESESLSESISESISESADVPDGPRGLRIERYGQRTPNFWRDGVIRVRLVVVAAIGDIVREIFMYERQLPSAGTGTILDVFQSVASQTDIRMFPVDDPDPSLADKFLRLSTIELDLCSEKEFDEFLERIKLDICGLIDALDAADVMDVIDDVQCGVPL